MKLFYKNSQGAVIISKKEFLNRIIEFRNDINDLKAKDKCNKEIIKEIERMKKILTLEYNIEFDRYKHYFDFYDLDDEDILQIKNTLETITNIFKKMDEKKKNIVEEPEDEKVVMTYEERNNIFKGFYATDRVKEKLKKQYFALEDEKDQLKKELKYRDEIDSIKFY